MKADSSLKWNKNFPPEKGWYRCRIDGEETRFYFFKCELSRKRQYWTDENSQRIMDEVEWTDG